MKRIIYMILVTLISFSCTKDKTFNNDEFYTVINDLIKNNYQGTGLAIIELSKVYCDSTFEFYTIDKKGNTTNKIPEKLISPMIINYGPSFFLYLCNKELLDSIDAISMINQINTKKEYILDSSKIDITTIRDSYIQEIGTDSLYRILKQQYYSHSFIQISTPIFSGDYNKMILTVDYYCGTLCGDSITYLLKKRNHKWEIIFKKRNWIS